MSIAAPAAAPPATTPRDMAGDSASITNVDELVRFRAAVVKALDELRLAAAEADTEIGRTRGWVERDQVTYWRGQIRKAQEAVVMCKSALFRKQMVTSSKDQKPSVVDEKKALERAQARLGLCEQKLAATKRWAIELPREEILFKSGMAPLGAMVERDLPHALSILAQMIQHLDAYLRLEAPDLARDFAPGADSMAAEMRRTGDAAKVAETAAADGAAEAAANDPADAAAPEDAAERGGGTPATPPEREGAP